MQADYTSQLEEIVKALNRQSAPTWLIAIASLFFGFFASALIEVFKHSYGEHRARSKMRKIIYSELGAMYSHLVDLQPTMVSGDDDLTHQDLVYNKFDFRLRFLNYQAKPKSQAKALLHSLPIQMGNEGSHRRILSLRA